MKALTADDPRFLGEFRLRGRLGEGGMGRVYLGLSPGGRAVAIKVDDGDAARRVRIPATIAALRALGVDAGVPDELSRPLLYGGGRVVGEVRVSLPF